MGDVTGASGTWGISITDNAATASIASVLSTDESMKLYAQYSNEINFGGTNDSSTIYFGYRAADSKPVPSQFVFGGNSSSSTIKAGAVYGAVWNNYAEFRICNEEFKPGQVVLENGDDTLSIASQRLQRGCSQFQIHLVLQLVKHMKQNAQSQ